ncbi:MAG: von Willebrand factor type A domain-containing protein [Hyphomicrobium sp.]
MTERDLEKLKSLPVPEACAVSKRAALDAAMKTFDSAYPQDSPKGNVIPLRQTETSTLKRSLRMYLSSRPAQALAASVAALVIAAPFAFQHMIRLERTQTVASVSKTDTGQSNTPAAVAPQPAPYVAEQDRLRTALGATDAEKKNKAETPAPAPQPGVAEVATVAPAEPQPSTAARVEMDALATGGAVTAAPPTPPPAALSSKLATLAKPQVRLGLGGPLDGRIAASRRGDSSAYSAEPSAQAWMGTAGEQRTSAIEDNRDKFDAKDVNAVKQVAAEPVSTFSVDVDTASYAFVRRALNAGRLPPKDAVRVEELINYFPYAYPAPESAETPFKPTVTVLPSPWNANNKLVHVAIKGYDLKSAERPRANLVFLLDVSGSMGPADRLPLVKNAFRLLVDQLKPDDTIGIVTYASGSGVALEPTKIADKVKILSAIDSLGAGGSTAGAAGIADAYRLAEAGFDKAAVNRIILATDGNFNVGITDQGELKSYIERKRQSGIFLSILGVGQGNHNDALMQALAQNGNGTAAYVDTLNEARKVLVDESSSTLFTIAKDVKAQIEWNPERIAEYRLIGYETRALKREDFNNDRVDAGDIGSGHTVTAIYEVTPVGAQLTSDDLRYGKKAAAVREPVDVKPAAASNELGFLKLRYKRPNEDSSQLITLPVTDSLAKTAITDAPAEQRFSIAVAAFAQMMKGESYTNGYSFDDIIALAQSARGDDPFGYRAEFLNLVRLAKSARR